MGPLNHCLTQIQVALPAQRKHFFLRVHFLLRFLFLKSRKTYFLLQAERRLSSHSTLLIIKCYIGKKWLPHFSIFPFLQFTQLFVNEILLSDLFLPLFLPNEAFLPTSLSPHPESSKSRNYQVFQATVVSFPLAEVFVDGGLDWAVACPSPAHPWAQKWDEVQPIVNPFVQKYVGPAGSSSVQAQACPCKYVTTTQLISPSSSQWDYKHGSNPA